jgi:hypothetical protein
MFKHRWDFYLYHTFGLCAFLLVIFGVISDLRFFCAYVYHFAQQKCRLFSEIAPKVNPTYFMQLH